MDDREMLDELSAAVLAVNRHLSTREVLQTIVTAARGLLECEYAALGVPDDQGGFAEFVVDGISDEQWAAIGPLPRQHGLLGAMLHSAQPERLPDVQADPRFGWWPRAHPVLKDFLGMPITDGEEILGAIYLANRRDGDGFTPDHERLLGVLAAHAAIALTNARLYEHSRELTLLEERHRVARELHDAIAQKLFSLRLTTEAAAAWVRRDPARAEEELAEIRRLAGQATDELTQIVAELRPRELADTGLAETLRRRVALLDRVHDAEVTFSESGRPRLTPRVEEVVLRVAEEALHNALRHAGAARVRVALTATDTGVVCEIADDGIGFDHTTPTGANARLGFASMRERARRAQGSLDVRSAPGSGTTVTLAVPGE
ncbi:signal transduction histidine kinase [Allocatelliglobosispora scoriae]|uniref:Signal transduction histidine kinase n=1 Tax=Allocatelliglobosispora scoriae TaxID=643052 RepID=A0A841BZ12_9ACTN|nr:GAF domain-containing sensor histidine kinase [Allocatelliglobosispora scoriae]MBB5872915.1 signal transduction histidine kinase [Allocatelliglobosispora scoriae]